MMAPWSGQEETCRMLARLTGEAVPHRPFWQGRPSLWSREAPLVADGELLDLAHAAQEKLTHALSELGGALTAPADFADRALADAEDAARAAIAKIQQIRLRIDSAALEEDGVSREFCEEPAHAP